MKGQIVSTKEDRFARTNIYFWGQKCKDKYLLNRTDMQVQLSTLEDRFARINCIYYTLEDRYARTNIYYTLRRWQICMDKYLL